MHQLDNPVWHALTGPQATVAEGRGRARRYRPAFSVFAALPDDATARDWADLAATVGTERTALLLPAHDPGPRWSKLGAFAIHQMVGSTLPPAPDVDGLVDLGAPDAAAMTELVTATDPGPWRSRTHELGAFLGVRIDGRIVAMAGQRMRLADAVEISAVCTDPVHRGRGLARALTLLVAHRIVATGRVPFLHVRSDNHAAIRAYDAAGFTHRATLTPGMYEVAA